MACCQISAKYLKNENWFPKFILVVDLNSVLSKTRKKLRDINQKIYISSSARAGFGVKNRWHMIDRQSDADSLAMLVFIRKGKNERIRVAICHPRSSSALIERPHTACRLRNLADFILSTMATTTTTTTTTSVDDAGLDDSSRTHISQSVRSCGNFDILEYGAMRELVEILCVSPQKLHRFDSRWHESFSRR